MDGVTSESGAFPDQTALLGQQTWYLSADELIGSGLFAIRVDAGLVNHLPRPARRAVVVRPALPRRGELRLFGIKRIPVEVLLAAHRRLTRHRIYHIDRVIHAVDHGIHPQTEQMLVVMRIHTRIYTRAPGSGVLVRVEGVRVEDARQLDLGLDGAVLVEDPLDGVLVVGGGEDLLDDEAAGAGDDDGVVAEVAVLEEDAGVLLMDADGVLDGAQGAVARGEGRVEVVDGALAVAAQGQRVGHVAGAVLAQVKGVFALVRVLGVAAGTGQPSSLGDHGGRGGGTD